MTGAKMRWLCDFLRKGAFFHKERKHTFLFRSASSELDKMTQKVYHFISVSTIFLFVLVCERNDGSCFQGLI